MNSMKKINLKRGSKIFNTAMVILMFVIITMFVAIGCTWASYPAEHRVTYTTNKLTWDSNTNIRQDGSAVLDLFSNVYTNVNSSDGKRLIAPGTSDTNAIVLRNSVDHAVNYTVIAYYIKNDVRIPVTVTFDGSGLQDTTNYALPSGINQSDVLRVVSGSVAANSEQNFSFNWSWPYETENLASDPSDTELGNDAALGKDETIKVGCYIIVEDDGGVVKASGVKTGDQSKMGLYIAIMAVALAAVLMMLLGDRSRKHEE